MSTKYDVTIVETLIHTFTVDVEPDEDPREAAGEAFVQAEKLDELENYSIATSHREVENTTAQ
ncbi:hypothetical protein [Mesorhizobium sp. M7A.F.Ca.MR.362.00.0.0]|uniref:hypothetical protein n=1 Tax=Mesorhizobium sp. M7A.F.Ca.MR.362.00.0.0 TaxID=2496779 RepID=UPI000FD400C8|nr:hypothetical protein [Mesorhizobium sp. M7A.F.Ca.MR.362.00.0.0]RUU76125.1 hypothetical protein EOC06_28115 [Mesorhizobium sp. M7A.F.Ca.MR.362.00.0.0]RWN95387.1 MAG: hypothetical protein EOS05_11380 [Mesorhizobium sp.]